MVDCAFTMLLQSEAEFESATKTHWKLILQKKHHNTRLGHYMRDIKQQHISSNSIALSVIIHIIQYIPTTFSRNCYELLGAISHLAAKMKPVKSHYIWGQWGTPSFESPLKTSRRGLIAALVQTQNNTSFLLWLGVSFVADKGGISFKAALWQWQTNMTCCEVKQVQFTAFHIMLWAVCQKTLMT